MNFTIPQKELAIALARCAAISPVKSSMPVLSHVKLSPRETALALFATDLEVGYTTAVDGLIWNERSEDGDIEFLLPAKTLHECIKALPIGEVTFEVKDNTATISGGTATFTLAGLDAVEFPAMQPAPEGQSLTISPSALATALHHVAYCQSKDETRHNLNGVHLLCEHNDDGELFAVATTTDGSRLCLDTMSLAGDDDDPSLIGEPIPENLVTGIIVPTKGVAEIIKLALGAEGPAVLGSCGTMLTLSLGDEILSIRLSDGEFPDANRVIPKNPQHTIQVKRPALVGALERVKIMTNKDSRGIDLTSEGDVLSIASSLPALGSEASDRVSAEIVGTPPPLRINIEFMLQALANIPTTSIQLQITSELAPIIISPVGTDFPQAIIMPMRGN